MGRLRSTDGDREWLLPATCLIGRSRACPIRLDDPEVSGQHALLRWRSGVWELQDLHSRNGTFVDGRMLGSGACVGLAAAARLGFGRPDEYLLVDAGAPEPHAVGLDADATIEADAGILALPDPARPEVTIIHRNQGWWLEGEAEITPIADGEIIVTRAGSWRLHLPEQLPRTHDGASATPSLASLSLSFLVSDDGQYVELRASAGGRVYDLKARAHHQPLLTLARARLRDRELPDEDQGWVLQDELIHALGCDARRLHVDIHRCRRQFAEIGVVDAVHIVERRPGTRHLRIGTAAIEVATSPPLLGESQ